MALFPSLVALLLVSVLADAKKPSRKSKAAIQVGEWPKIKLRDFRKAVNLAQAVFESTTCDELPPKVDAQGRAIALRFRVKTKYPGYVAMFWDEDRPAERATTRYQWFFSSQGPRKPPDWIVPSYNPLIYSYLWMSGFFQASTAELNSSQEDFQVDLPSPLTQSVAGWTDLAQNVLAPRVAIILIPSMKAVGVDYPIERRPGLGFFPVDIWNYRRIEPCVRNEAERRWGYQ